MKKEFSNRRVITLILTMVLMLSCALPLSLQQSLKVTPTPTSVPLLNISGQSVQNAQGASGGSGQSGSGSAGGGGQNGSDGSNNGSNTQVPTLIGGGVVTGPYAVKQIESLGHETISGFVCSTILPFAVNATAPNVSWVFNFVPQGANQGKWTYAYFIQRAGESHNASGSYTLSSPGTDGTLHLTMAGQDHVVFKGFDGNLPVHYKFDLVPDQSTSCPTVH